MLGDFGMDGANCWHLDVDYLLSLCHLLKTKEAVWAVQPCFGLMTHMWSIRPGVLVLIRLLEKNGSPHRWVESNTLGVVELKVQQDDAGGAVFGADEDAVVHVIHKVEVPRQPVDGHLLHV